MTITEPLHEADMTLKRSDMVHLVCCKMKAGTTAICGTPVTRDRPGCAAECAVCVYLDDHYGTSCHVDGQPCP